MIGTDPSGKGGIATVVSLLEGTGFMREHAITYVTSHREGSVGTKLNVAIRSLFIVAHTCLTNRKAIIHVHSASRASFVRKSIFIAVARLCGCKTVFHLHGGGFHRFSTAEASVWMRWWIRRTLENASRVIVLSEGWKKLVLDFAPAALVLVIPNSVRLDELSSSSMEEKGRILFLGRVDRSKGIFELLKAVSLVKENWPFVKLAIGGDGNLEEVRGAAEQLGVSDHIELLGWIGADKKKDELKRASIFALPSHGEGLPMAMLEAMAAKKAVVATPVGGITSVIHDDINGLLVPPENVELLAQALNRLLADPGLCKQLAARARETIERRFSTDTVLEKLSMLYRDLAGC